MEAQQDQLEVCLSRLKGKADELKNRLNEFLRDIHNKTQNAQQQQQYLWPELLEQYSVLGDQLNNLASSLTDENGSMLNHFVVIPQSIDPSQPEKIPDLFRTKTIPEMEESDLEMLNQCPAQKRQRVSERISNHQRICQDLSNQFEDSCGQLEFSTSFDPLSFDPNHSILKTFLGAIANGTNVKTLQPKQTSTLPPPHVSHAPPPTIPTPNTLPPNPSTLSNNPSLNIPNTSSITNQHSIAPHSLNNSLPVANHPPHIPPNVHQNNPMNIPGQPPTLMNTANQRLPGGGRGATPMSAAPKGSAPSVKMNQQPPGGRPNIAAQLSHAQAQLASLTQAQKQELLQLTRTGAPLSAQQQQQAHYLKIIMTYNKLHQQQQQQQQQQR